MTCAGRGRQADTTFILQCSRPTNAYKLLTFYVFSHLQKLARTLTAIAPSPVQDAGKTSTRRWYDQHKTLLRQAQDKNKTGETSTRRWLDHAACTAELNRFTSFICSVCVNVVGNIQLTEPTAFLGYRYVFYRSTHVYTSAQ